MDFNYGRFLNETTANYLVSEFERRRKVGEDDVVKGMSDMDVRELTYCTDLAPVFSSIFSETVPEEFSFSALRGAFGKVASGVNCDVAVTEEEKVLEAIGQRYAIEARYGRNEISDSAALFLVYFSDCVISVEKMIKKVGVEHGIKLKPLSRVVAIKRKKAAKRPSRSYEQLKKEERNNVDIFNFILTESEKAYAEWMSANRNLLLEMVDVYREKLPLDSDFDPSRNIFQPTSPDLKNAFVVMSREEIISYRSRAVKTPLMEGFLSGDFLSRFKVEQKI